MNEPATQDTSWPTSQAPADHPELDSLGSESPLSVQLWSYNYRPEPTGIGPVSAILAEGLRDRGHSIDVVAAHPHYPEARWGSRRLPYREQRAGIPVLRLPLWVGRASAVERYRQELTYMVSKFAALPVLGRPDVLLSVSPSFPALLPAMLNARTRRLPWVLWLQDILPDGAAATGVLRAGGIMNTARRLERAAYRGADLIVVPSRSFTSNLVRKGVSKDKITVIPNPATRTPSTERRSLNGAGETEVRVLFMGNIGFSQGLAPLVDAFERSPAMREWGVRLVITGNGVAEGEVREKIGSDRVEMLGLVDDDRLETELEKADIALVSQLHEGVEFNIPSKLMNFMAYGLPVLAAVNPMSEAARIIEESDGGWAVDSSRPESFPEKLAELVEKPQERAQKGVAAADYAQRFFTRERFVEFFEGALKYGIARAGGVKN
jgi:colanic acid biosynthesis glycosyl transferase WcaI